MEIDWNTLDLPQDDSTWRFTFLDCVQENFLYRYVGDVTEVRVADLQSEVPGPHLQHSGPHIVNIACGPPLGKSHHLVLCKHSEGASA